MLIIVIYYYHPFKILQYNNQLLIKFNYLQKIIINKYILLICYLLIKLKILI